MYCVLKLKSERRGTHLYYQRAEYPVKMWGITVKSCGWLSSFWETHSDYTIQNMTECNRVPKLSGTRKKSISRVGFLLLFWGFSEDEKLCLGEWEECNCRDALVYIAIYHWIKNGQEIKGINPNTVYSSYTECIVSTAKSHRVFSFVNSGNVPGLLLPKWLVALNSFFPSISLSLPLLFFLSFLPSFWYVQLNLLFHCC